jgi:dTDP-4-amino-4,6-dideoxygalactose transaminase
LPDAPASLGGKPAFDELLPLVKPALPQWDASLSSEIQEIVESGWLTKGKHLVEFETAMADYLGVRRVVGVVNCSVGLLMTYQVLGLRGKVIVPSYTFMATVHPLAMLGIEPVFVDVNPNTWNIDPREVERAITADTSAIVGVHIFGNPAAVEELQAVADKHSIPLLFDAAHGFGSKHDGQRIGGYGRAEIFSMSPTKLLVAGEGGVVATNDDALADELCIAREYGNDGSYDSIMPGINGRLAEFNAVLARRGIEMLDDTARGRQDLASAYTKRLSSIPGIRFQAIAQNDECSYKDYTIMVNEAAFGISRDQLAKALRTENIDTRAYYAPPVHRHRTYEHLLPMYQEGLPVTDTLANEALSLPIWSNMGETTVDLVGAAIERIQNNAAAVGNSLGR